MPIKGPTKAQQRPKKAQQRPNKGPTKAQQRSRKLLKNSQIKKNQGKKDRVPTFVYLDRQAYIWETMKRQQHKKHGICRRLLQAMQP